MAYLQLSDFGTKSVLRKFNLTPARRIGRGQFCSVYEDGPDKVLKLTCDVIQFESIRDYMEGPHFPSMMENFGCVGTQGRHKRDLFLFQTERLTPLKSAPPATKKLARQLLKTVRDHWTSDAALNRATHCHRFSEMLQARSDVVLEQVMQDTRLPQSLRYAFELLARMKSDYGSVSLDVHGANLMVRDDGELVLNDVVTDSEMLAAL